MGTGNAGTSRTLLTDALLHDDFTADPTGSPQWRLRPAGPLASGDGLVSVGPDGLTVTPTGRNPETGEPAFASVPEPLGDADHLRWALMAAAASGNGFPGFDVGERLTVEAEMSAQGYGLDRHPYGTAVPDPRTDLKVGAAVLVCVDMESGVVLDFIVTDGRLFAVYERLALPGQEHGAFSYAVPVRDRAPKERHSLAVSYVAGEGTAYWYVDGREVLRVDRLGLRVLDEAHLRRDNGRAEQPARPRQFTCGVALFTDQVWGQGVCLTVGRVTVHRGPVADTEAGATDGR